MRRVLVAACVLIVLLTSGAAAYTYYVKPDGTGDVSTIQAAVDTLAPGDTLILAGGVFKGDGNFNIVVPNKNFLIRSETGDPGDCVIDCEGHLGMGRRGFYFLYSDGGPSVQGITISNGNELNPGGAVHCEGRPEFRDCIFTSNYTAGSGGVAACVGADVHPGFRKCVFVSNEAGIDGGAIYISGVEVYVVIDSCEFYDNAAGGGGGAVCCYMHEAEAYILNSVFAGNAASTCGGAIAVVNMWASISICTFFANSAPTGSAICDWGGPMGCGASFTQNCIIAFGLGGSGYYQPHYCEWKMPLRCTNIYGNQGGDWVDSLAVRLGVDGNICADPAFCNIDFEPYDLSLCDYSPCLPGNHPDGYACGLIGALGEGCVCDPTSVRPSTWGAIKALYR